MSTAAIYLPTPEETTEYMKLLGISDDEGGTLKDNRAPDPSKYFAALCGVGGTKNIERITTEKGLIPTAFKKKKKKTKFLTRSKSTDDGVHHLSDSEEESPLTSSKLATSLRTEKKDKKSKRVNTKPSNPKKFAMTKPSDSYPGMEILSHSCDTHLFKEYTNLNSGQSSSRTESSTDRQERAHGDMMGKLKKSRAADARHMATQTDADSHEVKPTKREMTKTKGHHSKQKGQVLERSKTLPWDTTYIANQFSQDTCSSTTPSVMGDPTLVDTEGNTPLHVCCKSDDIQGAAFLLSTCPQMLGVENHKKQLPITVAIKRGNEQIVQMLLRACSDQQLLDSPTLRTRPLIHTTARYRRDVCMRHVLDEFLRRGLDAEIDDIHGRSAAHVAAKYGNLVCLQTLLEYGMCLYATDKNGYTPSFYARYYGQRQVVGYFILLEVCLQLAGAGEEETEGNASDKVVKPTKRIRDRLISSVKKIAKVRQRRNQSKRPDSAANLPQPIDKHAFIPDKQIIKTQKIKTDSRKEKRITFQEQPVISTIQKERHTPIETREPITLLSNVSSRDHRPTKSEIPELKSVLKSSDKERSKEIPINPPGKRHFRRLRSLEISQPFFDPSCEDPHTSMSWHGETIASSTNSTITEPSVRPREEEELDLRIEIPELDEMDEMDDSLTSPAPPGDMDQSVDSRGFSTLTSAFDSTGSTLMTKSSLFGQMSTKSLPPWSMEHVQGNWGSSAPRVMNTFMDCDTNAKLEMNILKHKEKLSKDKHGSKKLDISVDEFGETYAYLPTFSKKARRDPPGFIDHEGLEATVSLPGESPTPSDDENVHDMVADTLCGSLELDSDRSSLMADDVSSISDGTSRFTTSEVICGITV